MSADKQSNSQQILQAAFDVATQAVTVTGSITTTPAVGASTSAKQDEQTALLTSLDGKTTEVDTGNVTVASSALPTGASTSAKQDTGNTSLNSIDTKIVAVNTGAVVVSSSALPTDAATQTTLAALNAKVTAVDTGAVVVSSSALPTGAAVESKQDTANTSLSSIDTKLSSLTVTTSALSRIQTPVYITGDNLAGSAGSRYLAATLSGTVKRLQIGDTTGQFWSIYDAAAAGNKLLIVNPGCDGWFDITIASGATLYIISETTTGGTADDAISINFFG